MSFIMTSLKYTICALGSLAVALLVHLFINSCVRFSLNQPISQWISPVIERDSPVFPSVSDDLDWWQSTVIYQIYPRSFKDSTGNGVGDIPGIISKLDYFEYLGIETIWLSPVYPSPMKDHGYDVSNYTDIDPLFGTLQDFDHLVAELHKRKMKIVMDFIPNHSSDQHPWFLESKKGGADNIYTDYYIWHDGIVGEDGERRPPNNWLSIFGGSAWTWMEERHQFYFHQYTKEQPDFNWRNPKVHEEMLKVFAFWLDHGVDGFRIDTISTLYETEDVFQDNPRSFYKGKRPDENAYLLPKYTRHQPECYVVTQEWRTFFDDYEKRTGRHHIYMVVELYDITMDRAIKYYSAGTDGPFNFNLVYLNSKNLNGTEVHRIVNAWLTKMPAGKWPNWVLGNHDRSRVASNVGSEYVEVMTLLLLLLPGTPTVYQGDEIGMLNVDVTWEQAQDPLALYVGKELYKKYTRDIARAPVSWSAEKNAGFSDGDTTWLPVHQDYKDHNIKAQMTSPDPINTLQLFRQAIQLRKDPSFLRGSLAFTTITPDLFSFTREHPDSRPYLVILNVGGRGNHKDASDPALEDFRADLEEESASEDTDKKDGKQQFVYDFSDVKGLEGKVVLATSACEMRIGDRVDLKSIQVKHGCGVVIF